MEVELILLQNMTCEKWNPMTTELSRQRRLTNAMHYRAKILQTDISNCFPPLSLTCQFCHQFTLKPYFWLHS